VHNLLAGSRTGHIKSLKPVVHMKFKVESELVSVVVTAVLLGGRYLVDDMTDDIDDKQRGSAAVARV
jgi:hypothetical protein